MERKLVSWHPQRRMFQMVPPERGCIQGPDVLIVGRDRISQCLLGVCLTLRL